MGGENIARTPIDHLIWTMKVGGAGGKDDGSSDWKLQETSNQSPSERVAHSQSVVTDDDGTPWLYVFGGRQGVMMDEAPLNDLHRMY